MSSAKTSAGGCLCGAVRFTVNGPLRGVVNCHCGQCRRTHGHYAAYSAVASDGLAFVEDRGLKWYQSSDMARRGFCMECGASLFWQPLDKSHMAVAAGSLDQPTGLVTTGNIFTAHKGDYYVIDDGLENSPGTMADD